MTQDGFITLLSLIVAGLAVLPPVRRLRLRLVLTQSLAISVPALFGVLYFEFFKLTGVGCPEWVGKACTYLTVRPGGAVDAEDAASFVVMAWTVAMLLLFTRDRIGPSAIRPLATAVSELLQDRQYAKAIDLVVPHLSLINAAAERRLPSQRRYDCWARRRERETGGLMLLLHGEDEKPPSLPKRKADQLIG